MRLIEKLNTSIASLFDPEINSIGVFCDCDNWLKPVSVDTFLGKLGLSDKRIEFSRDLIEGFFKGKNNVLYCRVCEQYYFFEDEHKELYKVNKVTKKNELELFVY